MLPETARVNNLVPSVCMELCCANVLVVTWLDALLFTLDAPVGGRS